MIRAVDENVRLDAAERHRLIDRAIANLKQHYIYPDAAQENGGCAAGARKERR